MQASPKASSTTALLVLVGFVAVSAGLIFAATRGSKAPDIPGLLWPDPPVLANFSLQGSAGKPIDQHSLEGRWTLLFFGFTNCPDVCPTTLAVLKQTVARLADYPPFREQGQVLFISLDPARDTPAQLGQYVQHFDTRFLAATGDDAALDAVTVPLGVIRAKVEDGSGGYSIDHTASIFLIDPKLRVIGKFGLPHSAAMLDEGFRTITAFRGAQ